MSTAPPPPGRPLTAAQRPSRRVLALLAAGVAAVVLMVAGLGSVAYRLTGELASRPDLGQGPGASLLGTDGSSSTALAGALEGAGLDCLVEVAQPQVRSCWALHESRWANVSWQAAEDDTVLGLWIDLDLTAGAFSSRDAVLGGLRTGLGLGEDDVTGLSELLEEARAVPGEESWVDTGWGEFYATADADRHVVVDAFSWSGEPEYHQPRSLGPTEQAVALLQRRGYSCEEVDEMTTSCSTEDYATVDLHGGPDLTGFDITPYAATADVAAELTALADPAEAATIGGLLDGVGDDAAVTASQGWTVVHLEDWVRVSGGSW